MCLYSTLQVSILLKGSSGFSLSMCSIKVQTLFSHVCSFLPFPHLQRPSDCFRFILNSPFFSHFLLASGTGGNWRNEFRVSVFGELWSLWHGLVIYLPHSVRGKYSTMGEGGVQIDYQLRACE